ncbi:hypothetical protein GS688_07895 [Rhodococcus hoagii]|nr:hypothetical protein [Prescottella equi]NKT17616.1 hypothetical protein [Prescottella equi]
MNGAQHYAEAGRLLTVLDGGEHGFSTAQCLEIATRAQAHASLAQVAATIDAAAWSPRLVDQQWRAALASEGSE